MFKRLLFILEWVLRAISSNKRAQEQTDHEQRVKEIQDDPAGDFANKFGRVQPDADSGADAVPDAATADKADT